MANAPIIKDVMGFVNRGTKFEDVSSKAKETDSCVICMCNFEHDDEVAELNCAEGHIFHSPCLEQWFTSQ